MCDLGGWCSVTGDRFSTMLTINAFHSTLMSDWFSQTHYSTSSLSRINCLDFMRALLLNYFIFWLFIEKVKNINMKCNVFNRHITHLCVLKISWIKELIWKLNQDLVTKQKGYKDTNKNHSTYLVSNIVFFTARLLEFHVFKLPNKDKNKLLYCELEIINLKNTNNLT